MSKNAYATREITMPFGRVIPLADDTSEWNMRVWPVNYPVQGSSSDIVSRAVCMINRVLRKDLDAIRTVDRWADRDQNADLQQALRTIRDRSSMWSHVILSIHDSIVSDVAPNELDTVLSLKQGIMESRCDYPWLICPLKADTSFGPDWGVQKSLEEKFIQQGARLDRAGNAVTE